MLFCTQTPVLDAALKNLVRLLRSHKSLVCYGEVGYVLRLDFLILLQP